MQIRETLAIAAALFALLILFTYEAKAQFREARDRDILTRHTVVELPDSAVWALCFTGERTLYKGWVYGVRTNRKNPTIVKLLTPSFGIVTFYNATCRTSDERFDYEYNWDWNACDQTEEPVCE